MENAEKQCAEAEAKATKLQAAVENEQCTNAEAKATKQRETDMGDTDEGGVDQNLNKIINRDCVSSLRTTSEMAKRPPPHIHDPGFISEVFWAVVDAGKQRV